MKINIIRKKSLDTMKILFLRDNALTKSTIKRKKKLRTRVLRFLFVV